MKRLIQSCAAGLLLAASTLHAAPAEELTFGQLKLPAGSLWLAAADEEGAVPPAISPTPPLSDAQRAEAQREFDAYEEPWFTGAKVHQYLGIGSIALATLAVLSPKEEDGPHEYFARGAAALGGAAVASGLVFHWDDIANGGGLSDPDNQHALLAGLGALGYALAVSQAPDSQHAGAGATGFVLMAVGIRLTW